MLGRLYGWNTLGAVAGAVAAETLWIGALGIRGTAWAAGALNLLAAAGAAWIAPRMTPVPVTATASTGFDRSALPGLAAAFAFGFLLLALEVVWFRYLSLFVFTHSVAFALMLGVVLAGIALGGIAAGWALRSGAERHRLAGPLALLAGAACVGCYAAFPTLASPYSADQIRDAGTILTISVFLMLPVSLVSGALFPLLGAGLRELLGSDARTTGALTLANTAGAALGALAAGFVLLPAIGVEASFFWLAGGLRAHRRPALRDEQGAAERPSRARGSSASRASRSSRPARCRSGCCPPCASASAAPRWSRPRTAPSLPSASPATWAGSPSRRASSRRSSTWSTGAWASPTTTGS